MRRTKLFFFNRIQQKSAAILSVTLLLFVVGGFRSRDCLFIIFVECFFESTDRFTEPFSKFGKFFRTENDKGNHENDQKVSRLKETFKHNLYLQSHTSPEIFLTKRLA